MPRRLALFSRGDRKHFGLEQTAVASPAAGYRTGISAGGVASDVARAAPTPALGPDRPQAVSFPTIVATKQ